MYFSILVIYYNVYHYKTHSIDKVNFFNLNANKPIDYNPVLDMEGGTKSSLFFVACHFYFIETEMGKPGMVFNK